MIPAIRVIIVSFVYILVMPGAIHPTRIPKTLLLSTVLTQPKKVRFFPSGNLFGDPKDGARHGVLPTWKPTSNSNWYTSSAYLGW